ncbi:acyl-CoA dehydrogenase, partial [Mycobacterium sp. ITM-2017-0098]
SGSSVVTLGVRSAQVIVAAARAGADTVWFVVDPSQPGVVVDGLVGTVAPVDVGVLRLDGYACAADSVLTGIDDDRARCVVVALTAAAASGT